MLFEIIKKQHSTKTKKTEVWNPNKWKKVVKLVAKKLSFTFKLQNLLGRANLKKPFSQVWYWG